MRPLKTLREAVESRLSSHKPLGWTPSRRRLIEIRGGAAILTLSWLASNGRSMIDTLPDDKSIVRDMTISVDTSNLPKGVSVRSWSALPDTIDYIMVPSEDEIADVAYGMLGCRHVDRGDRSDGTTIYWMVK